MDDWSQGIPLSYTRELADYWANEYDWRSREAALNRFDQFVTEIDGLDIHFIHRRSPHEDAFPLVITHGWPGSIVEFHKVIEPLTNPASGRAEDAAVPVTQYTITLSSSSSRLNAFSGCPSQSDQAQNFSTIHASCPTGESTSP